MFVAITFSVFLLILFLALSIEQKKQRELEERISQLAYQKRDLASIISFLINPSFSEKLTDEDKKDIDDLANDILTQYSNNEEITEMLERMVRRLNNIEKEIEDEIETDPMFDGVLKDLDNDDNDDEYDDDDL